MDFLIKLFALIGVVSVLYVSISLLAYYISDKLKLHKYYNFSAEEETPEVMEEYIEKVVCKFKNEIRNNYKNIKKITVRNTIYYERTNNKIKGA
uniref:hypothetical protein n=1 Tax=Brachyspira catarrhinii TaxID=2528966 RepID=UPI003F4C3094